MIQGQLSLVLPDSKEQGLGRASSSTLFPQGQLSQLSQVVVVEGHHLHTCVGGAAFLFLFKTPQMFISVPQRRLLAGGDIYRHKRCTHPASAVPLETEQVLLVGWTKSPMTAYRLKATALPNPE